MKELNYTIPRVNPSSDVQSSLKEDATMMDDDDDKQKDVIDYEGFKIRQGTSIVT